MRAGLKHRASPKWGVTPRTMEKALAMLGDSFKVNISCLWVDSKVTGKEGGLLLTSGKPAICSPQGTLPTPGMAQGVFNGRNPFP